MQNSEFAMEPFSPIPNLIEQVHARLVDAIADGTLPPGERLTQEDIAERLSVSRQPVSHALQLLRRQGLVIDSGKRGVEVAPVDPTRIRDLYRVRAALDGLASRLAAGRVAAGEATAREIATLRGALAAGQALPEDADMHDWIAVDVAFHTAVYVISGNAAISETVGEQWPHFKRCMGAVLAHRDKRTGVWGEHEAIAKGILDGDPDAAAEAAIRHSENAGVTLYTRLSKDNANA
jgi:DNA-binding GntR family transcriptional regulator